MTYPTPEELKAKLDNLPEPLRTLAEQQLASIENGQKLIDELQKRVDEIEPRPNRRKAGRRVKRSTGTAIEDLDRCFRRHGQLTARDIAELTGWDSGKVKRILKLMQTAGKLEVSTTEPVTYSLKETEES